MEDIHMITGYTAIDQEPGQIRIHLDIEGSAEEILLDVNEESIQAFEPIEGAGIYRYILLPPSAQTDDIQCEQAHGHVDILLPVA